MFPPIFDLVCIICQVGVRGYGQQIDDKCVMSTYKIIHEFATFNNNNNNNINLYQAPVSSGLLTGAYEHMGSKIVVFLKKNCFYPFSEYIFRFSLSNFYRKLIPQSWSYGTKSITTQADSIIFWDL